MASDTKQVDVAINVYGKPLQTAVALFSLIQHSGHHIDKIYLTLERKQPPNSNFDLIYDRLGDRLVSYTPGYFLWTYPLQFLRPLLSIRGIRHSLRYQYAWERTDKKYLFITHNDVLYTADVIGYLRNHIAGHIGAGQVGMCWSCSAHAANVCSGDRYLAFRPSPADYADFLTRFPQKRQKIHRRFEHRESAWPLPECRLNEWACMIDLEVARPITMPHGKILPFGAMMLDIGTEWFFQVHQLGHSVKHLDLAGHAVHAWASADGSGHSALFDRSAYDRGSRRRGACWRRSRRKAKV